jgi:biotin operon repressor
MQKKDITTEQLTHIINQYTVDFMSLDSIAKNLGWAENTVRKCLANQGVTIRKIGDRPNQVKGNATCHPDQLLRGNGLCSRCYMQSYQRPVKLMAMCHPKRPNYAKGKCILCYQKTYYQDKRGYTKLPELESISCGKCSGNAILVRSLEKHKCFTCNWTNK